jgi:putative endonuclease
MWIPRQDALWRADGSLKQFTVYVMSNNSMTLYTGVTSNIIRRVWEHKNKQGCEFTRRYHFDRLVYLETYSYAAQAIAREKQIKGLSRAKKIALIKTKNPSWKDLSEL